MQRVFVIDKNKNPLMPCHPARARELLKAGKAAVFRRYPFTIILKEREGGDVQEVQIKTDPGSKTTGIAVMALCKGNVIKCVWSAELTHRGEAIKASLMSRRGVRHNRRAIHTRYRPARFSNRKRPKGWLPPSLGSRVHNIEAIHRRIMRLVPVTHLAMELVRFDTQLMENPEISGIEYQQGTLYGYEIREYLLEKIGRKCAYCGATSVPLQIEHIRSKHNGGSNRVSNLTMACQPCNQKKGKMNADTFGYPEIQKQAKKPLKDAAAVNSTRWRLYETLRAFGLPLEVGTGGRTKYNRFSQELPKAHWIDAACVGESGERVVIDLNHRPLLITANGRQNRRMCDIDAHGFRRRKKDGSFVAPKGKRVKFGFQTGDIVRATQPSKGRTFVGRLTVASDGNFKISPLGSKEKYMVRYKNCTHIHRADGYSYAIGSPATHPAP